MRPKCLGGWGLESRKMLPRLPMTFAPTDSGQPSSLAVKKMFKNIFKKLWLASLPLILGPGGPGTLMGESGVKFRVERHPPEVERPEFD